MRRKQWLAQIGATVTQLVGLPVLFSASPELGLAGEFPASYGVTRSLSLLFAPLEPGSG